MTDNCPWCGIEKSVHTTEQLAIGERLAVSVPELRYQGERSAPKISRKLSKSTDDGREGKHNGGK